MGVEPTDRHSHDGPTISKTTPTTGRDVLPCLATDAPHAVCLRPISSIPWAPLAHVCLPVGRWRLMPCGRPAALFVVQCRFMAVQDLLCLRAGVGAPWPGRKGLGACGGSGQRPLSLTAARILGSRSAAGRRQHPVAPSLRGLTGVGLGRGGGWRGGAPPARS